MPECIVAKALSEFIGSFIFFTVILVATSKTVLGPASGVMTPIAIVTALFVAIMFGGQISGGHFNPAVSIMKAIQSDVTITEAGIYIVVQIMAALAAFYFFKSVHEKCSHTKSS